MTDDIELVIKIPEELYQKIKEMTKSIVGRRSCKTINYILVNAVANGAPLPKTEWKIGDLDAIRKEFEEGGMSREEQLFNYAYINGYCEGLRRQAESDKLVMQYCENDISATVDALNALNNISKGESKNESFEYLNKNYVKGEQS